MIFPDQIAPLFGFFTLIVFCMGACIGSFLNVCVWRLPRRESLIFPGSHCPKCDHAIAAWENIPVFSWLLLRGRCRNCKQPISIRYPLVELATAVLFVALWLRVWYLQLPLITLPGDFFLVAALLTATLTDLEHRIIPNVVTYTGIVVALLLALVFPGSHSAALPLELRPALPFIVTDVVVAQLPAAWQVERVIAIVDATLGAVLGAGVLALFLWIGQRLWGRQGERRDQAVSLVLSTEQLVIDGESCFWSDVLWHPKAHLSITAETTTIQLRGEQQPRQLQHQSLVVDSGGIRVGQARYPWNNVVQIQVQARRWQLPRQVMGLGDVKLLAMIGGFVGPDSMLFIITMASVGGFFSGLLLWLLRRRDHNLTIPFAPFLAGAVLVWLFCGEPLINWYLAQLQ